MRLQFVMIFVLMSGAGARAQQVAISPSPEGLAADSAGNLYFTGKNCIFKLDQNGVETRIAGNSQYGYAGDGGLAADAQLRSPSAVAVDGKGNLYIADTMNYRIRKVSPDGLIATIAGTGTPPSPNSALFADGRIATVTPIRSPTIVTVDGAGNVYFTGLLDYRIHKVSSGGIITTVAGTGVIGSTDDGRPATEARISPWGGMVADDKGNLYFSEGVRIRKVSVDGVITTIVGNGKFGYSGDGGAATNAQIAFAGGLAIDKVGNLYIADSNNFRIRKVSSDGIITTVAGNGSQGYSGDEGTATSAQLALPHVVAVDPSGSLYISDGNRNPMRKVSADGTITTVSLKAPLDDFPSDPELVQAARSPYDIQRFVETHFNFDWGPLAKALNIKDGIGLDCEGDQERHNCSSELITIMDPPRTVVCLTALPMNETYLVFIPESQPDGLPQWRFAGHFHQFVRYWELEHRIVTLGKRPYLVMNEQGISGTGVASEIENWRDLTGPDFDPVLSYTTKGHYEGSERSFIRDFEATTISTEEKPVPSITLSYRLDFSGYRNPPLEPDLLGLGHRSDKVVYGRTPEGRFTIDTKSSSLTSAGVLALYSDKGPACEEFLKYALAPLKEIATGTNSDGKRWLKEFLDRCGGNTVEQKELTALLARSSSTR